MHGDHWHTKGSPRSCMKKCTCLNVSRHPGKLPKPLGRDAAQRGGLVTGSLPAAWRVTHGMALTAVVRAEVGACFQDQLKKDVSVSCAKLLLRHSLLFIP